MSVLVVIKYLAFAEQLEPETAAIMGGCIHHPGIFYRFCEKTPFVTHFVVRGFRKCEPPGQIRPCGPGCFFAHFSVIVTGSFYDTMSVNRCIVSQTKASRLLFCLTLNLTQFYGVDRDIVEFVDTAEPRRRSAQRVHVQTAERTGSFSRVRRAS